MKCCQERPFFPAKCWEPLLLKVARNKVLIDPMVRKLRDFRFGMHWHLAQYAANLPPDRWLSRILTWICRGRHTVGRPRSTWNTMIQNFCRYQHLGHWRDVLRKGVNFKCFGTALRWKNLCNLFAPTPWKIYSATSCGCFRMHAGRFACWSAEKFGEAECSD